MPASPMGLLPRALRGLAGGLALSLLAASASHATITTYNTVTAFNNAAIALGGAPSVVVDFDAIAAGMDISNATINGILFSNDDDNLTVVNAADVGLPATSGARILSPGGTDLSVELDTVRFSFGPSIGFGLDILFEAGYDGTAMVRYDYTTTSEGGAGSGFGTVSIGGANAGSYFLGFTSDDPTARLTSITISDNDPNHNLGYDTIRRATAAVPEPTTWALMIGGFGLAGGMLRRRRAALA